MTINNVYNTLKKAINVTSAANEAVANNIANVNTEGYKRYYVPFEQAMNDANSNSGLKTTSSRHISEKSDEIQVKQDNSTSMREDGNNVDIESEMADQAANTLMYQSLVRFVSGKITTTKNVIKGGA